MVIPSLPSHSNENSAITSCDERGKLLFAHLEVLPYLHDAQMVGAALGLYWEDVVRSASVDAYVHLVCLELSLVDRRAQMTLERVGGNPGVDIEESVVAKLCEQALLVGERVPLDDARRGVRDLCDCQSLPRGDRGKR
jgi:hypothetical protein